MIAKQKWWISMSVAVLAALAMITGKTALSQDEPGESEQHEPGTFTVDGDNVDEATFRGYEAYGRACAACHGPDGVGSSFAPSLVQAAERRTFEEFQRTVVEGQELQPGMVMPSFADDQYVMEHVGEIYSYMKARAEGGLGRGRPGIIAED